MELRSITAETLAAFAQALRAEERCTETIKQYTRSVRQFAAWLAPETVAAGSAGGEKDINREENAWPPRRMRNTAQTIKKRFVPLAGALRRAGRRGRAAEVWKR